jgi:hypoxanthine phosphoribosyltransferase
VGSRRKDNYYLALRQIAKVANSDLSTRRIFNSVAKSAAKAVGANGCRISFLDAQKEYLINVGAHGLSDFYLKKAPLEARKSIPEVLNGEVVYIADATKDERIQHAQIAKAQRISSILAAPITEKGEVSGEIRLYTHDIHQFSEGDKNFLLAVANLSAALLAKDELQRLLGSGYKGLQGQSKLPQLPTTSLRPTEFAHPSEEEFARLLDFYQIEWLYEPRSFPLRWENGGIVGMFTPDFYLPEFDLYIELTTLKQGLVTEKHRKVRRLKELYPEVNIKLLNKNDFLRLLAKYGYGSLACAKVPGIDRILFTHNQIQRRVKALARQISRDYEGENLVLVGILKGIVCFMTDLMQHLSLPVSVDFMAISYYGGGESQLVKITKDLDDSITGRHVLMVEDIVDTGMTLNYVLKYLLAHEPASLRVCTLLDKRARRLVDVPLDYVGFEIPDEFIVGYGLDYRGEYRNLPFIGTFHPELAEEGESGK